MMNRQIFPFLRISAIAVLIFMHQAARPAENKITLSTNLLGYAALATINADIGIALQRHWSLHAGGRYNPFSYGHGADRFHIKQGSGYLQARYWPWYSFSGWYAGGKLQFSRFNTGGILSGKTRQGDAAGFGIEGGYALMLGKSINLEFSIGIWSGWTSFAEYSSPRCGPMEREVRKFFIFPDDVKISIQILF